MGKKKDKASENEFLVTLTTANGETLTYEFLDRIEYQDEEYVILYPAGTEDGDCEIVQVDQVDLDNGTESYRGIDDEKILSKVFDLFLKRVEEAEKELEEEGK